MHPKKWLALLLAAGWGLWSWAWFFPPRPRVGPLEASLLAGSGPVLVIAPHSDDEALAAGGLLQQAEEQGAAPRVVLVTGGDAFTWSAKAHYRRWEVTPREMLAYGQHRVTESEDGLTALGLPRDRLIFLGYPDGQINNLWTRCWREQNPCTGPFTGVAQVAYPGARSTGSPYAGEVLLKEMVDLLREVRPAMVVYPHPNDAHVDHWGVSSFVTAALEQLRRSEPDWQPPAEWLYLVHRGGWPAPKGYRPDDVLLPPEKLAREAMTSWHELPLTGEQVERKYKAVEQYRTQTRILARYMHSFIRANELFGTMERVELRAAEPWDSILADLAPGGLEGGIPPWTGLTWQMAIADPQADTVAREVQRGADVLRVWTANDGKHLYVAVRTSAPMGNPLEFRISGRGYLAVGGWVDPFQVVVRPGNRYVVSRWTGGGKPSGLAVQAAANWTRLDLPLAELGDPLSVMVNVETRLENLLIDRTAWRLLSLDGR